MLKDINSVDEFNNILKQGGVVLVEFYTDYCVPCKEVKKSLEEISEDMTDVTFITVDAIKNPEIAGLYRVMSAPTIITFKNNYMVDCVRNSRSKDELTEMLNKWR